MKTARARAPLRLGFGGGGTDVSPYPEIYGGAILNATIDLYAYASVTLDHSEKIRFSLLDINANVIFERSDILEYREGPFALVVAVYRYVMRNYNNGILIPMHIVTHCDAPPGSGLGSSSTLVVAVLRAMFEYMEIRVAPYSLANMAYTIERSDCGLIGGKQDQYSAVFGGVNLMEFSSDPVPRIQNITLKPWIRSELESMSLLYYTGISRHSANIIAEQSSNIDCGITGAIESMHQLKAEAYKMRDALLQGDFDAFVGSLRMGWKSKKKTAQSVSNDKIENAFTAAIDSGALAGKVSGAGGGGFIWFLLPPNLKPLVANSLSKLGGRVFGCKLTLEGVESWTVYHQFPSRMVTNNGTS